MYQSFSCYRPTSSLITLLIFVVSVGWMASAFAAKPTQKHLTIIQVAVDLENDELTITGEDLDFGPKPLAVTLGTFDSLTIIGSPTNTTIVAGIPANLPDGDYLLIVSRGKGKGQNDEYDLTIGAGGGAEGPPGADGADGTSCSIAGTIVSCTDGTSADVEGPPGADGATGPRGPAGPAGPSFESANNGGSQAHNNMQPFLTVNCIIALEGAYPSRDGVQVGEPFLGQIKFFAGNFAPSGWAFCDGQLLPVSQNSALFSLLGTIYGGDGRTTFGLPDSRGRVFIHAGSGPGLTQRRVGLNSGAETHTLNTGEIPSHNHNP